MKVAIAAGGTAGHVVPALAVADALRAEGAEVEFVGGERAEAELVPAAGYRFHALPVVGIDRRNPLKAARAIARAVSATARARKLLRRIGADVVIGGGGYVAGPVGLAARSLRLPLVLTEADSHLGIANRLLAPFAKRVFLAFPVPGRDGDRYAVVGRPVPAGTLGADRTIARERFAIAAGERCLLVFGGSLGARTINDAALEAFGAAAPFTVLHACGKRDYDDLARRLEQLGSPPHYHLHAYIQPFADALAAADLTVARSGGSVFEVAAAGVPSILVPYPHATADHQTLNARHIAAGGAAVVVPDAELDGPRLAREVGALLGDENRLRGMEREALALARPDAAATIAREVLALGEEGAAVSAEQPFGGRRLHFVGIGGAGMSGLALVAAELGAEVTGSDRADSSYTARLRAAGIDPAIGHDAANLPADAEVVVSTAIPAENPELAAAHAAGASIIHRGALLGELTRLKRSIAIAGTHGKTTTCGMVAHVLRATGRDPAFVIGGELRSAGTNAAWGTGDWIVAEADESDRSFLELARDVAVVTNIELDHHATYRSLADLQATFARFTAPAELSIAWKPAADALIHHTTADPGASTPDAHVAAGDEGPSSDSQAERAFVSRGVPPTRGGPTTVRETYGIDQGHLRAENITLRPMASTFTVDGTPVRLNVPGTHNILNALAALGACRAAGVPIAEAAPAIAGFGGTGRRFEDRGTTAAGARVYDDYAHHPTEVRATLEAARTLGARRIVACFQPHLYSRTRELAWDFGRALAIADVVAVIDVYPARERAEDFPGVSGLLVAEAAADAAPGRSVWWLPAIEAAERMLRDRLGEGDVLLTLGAGDVDRLADRLTADGEPAAASAKDAP